MNLTTGSWIPVLTDNSDTIIVGLCDLYENAEKYRDLALNPPQRISVMRLLICITQAALDGPENEADWLECESRIIPKSLEYLEKHKDEFNLYGDKPFLQIAGITAKERKPLDKLEFSSPSASTLFEHQAASDIVRDRSSGWKAINILTLMNFHTTGKVGQAIWNEENYNFSTYPTTCIGLLHSFVKGESILKTLYLNLLTKEEVKKMPNGDWGKPIWESMPNSENDSAPIKNATKTYLGRLVPLSRLVLVDEKGTQCIIGPTPKTMEFQGVPSFREPSTTVAISGKNEPYCMKVNSDKHIWRDLESVLQISASYDKGAPLNLRKINRLASYLEENSIDIWAGGLELGDQAAKLYDVAEWNLSIPLSFFQDGTLDYYSKGVDLADKGSASLKHAISEYLNIIGDDRFQKDDKSAFKRKGKEDWKKREKVLVNSESHFWQSLDNQYNVLIDAVANKKPLDDEWWRKIYSAMQSAFEYACPHETPRQIQAYAQAKALLTLKKPGSNG